MFPALRKKGFKNPRREVSKRNCVHLEYPLLERGSNNVCIRTICETDAIPAVTGNQEFRCGLLSS